MNVLRKVYQSPAGTGSQALNIDVHHPIIKCVWNWRVSQKMRMRILNKTPKEVYQKSLRYLLNLSKLLESPLSTSKFCLTFP
jgi:hypothetical protein